MLSFSCLNKAQFIIADNCSTNASRYIKSKYFVYHYIQFIYYSPQNPSGTGLIIPNRLGSLGLQRTRDTLLTNHQEM